MFTDTDYSQAHHNDIMLLQGNQPWIFNPRLVVLTDAYRHLQPEAMDFHHLFLCIGSLSSACAHAHRVLFRNPKDYHTVI